MIGQCYSPHGQRYNVLIMAAGMGSRMGTQAEHIPKALSSLGGQRAIDWIIQRYAMIAHKIVIGVGWQKDLLTNYVKGKWGNLVEFADCTEEGKCQENAKSAMVLLDHADSRYPTILTFCDLLMVDNFEIIGDTLYMATEDTDGVVGVFRHGVDGETLIEHETPITIKEGTKGLIGSFVFSDTPSLKEIAYAGWKEHSDLTWDIVRRYVERHKMNITVCKKIFEFGSSDDLAKVRSMWEEA